MLHMRASANVAGAMVFSVGWNLFGMIERVIWDSWEAKGSKQSMKALIENSIKWGVFGKQIFDFLLERENLVNGTTIGKASADHNIQEFFHSGVWTKRWLGIRWLRANISSLTVFLRRISLMAKLGSPQSTLESL